MLDNLSGEKTFARAMFLCGMIAIFSLLKNETNVTLVVNYVIELL